MAVNAWMARADEDLQVASLLIERERRLLGAAVYHCQQAAEKSLKAWLTSQDLRFPKTHDLETLLAMCRADESVEWPDLTEHAQLLTPYAVEFRYPGDQMEPESEEAVRALDLAREVHAFVASRIVSRG